VNPDQYPEGRLNEHDEGAVSMAIHTEAGNVRIDFPKPVAWLAMPPNQALAFAAALARHARHILDNTH
jgi:hypothetical protein